MRAVIQAAVRPGGGGADSGAIGDDDNAAGRRLGADPRGQRSAGHTLADAKREVGTQKAPARRRRARTIVAVLGVTGVLAAAATWSAYLVAGHQRAAGVPRPSGIPATVSTSLARLMALSPVPVGQAPGFTLTDQNGRVLTLAALRGKVVVLEFMDPHCVDICPIVSDEFLDAYHDLGTAAGRVVFAAVNVNPYHDTVADVAGFSRAHQLVTIPGWHFFTGSVPQLRNVWHAYGILVQPRGPDADVVHSSEIYFIDARGRQRYLAVPMAGYNKAGTAYLPSAPLAAWGRGIALVARDLLR